MNFPIRTGFDLVENPNTDVQDREFMRMVVSLMKILCEEALKSAARYCVASGRSEVSSGDMVRALQYESHVFWDKNIDERFVQNMEEERAHTYDTTDDEGEDSDDESSDGDEEEVQNQVAAQNTIEEECFRNAVDRIHASWAEWTPEDPVKQMLKRAIDSTSERFRIAG